MQHVEKKIFIVICQIPRTLIPSKHGPMFSPFCFNDGRLSFLLLPYRIRMMKVWNHCNDSLRLHLYLCSRIFQYLFHFCHYGHINNFSNYCFILIYYIIWINLLSNLMVICEYKSLVPFFVFHFILYQLKFTKKSSPFGSTLLKLDYLAHVSKDWLAEFTTVQVLHQAQPPKPQFLGSHHLQSCTKLILIELFSRGTINLVWVVIRDSQCQVIVSLSQQLPQCLQAVEIEAITASQALEFGFGVGITQAILEGDSEVIIKALVENESFVTSFDPSIQDAKVFSRSFNQLLYSHISREGNKLAHSPARHSLNVSDCVV